MYCTRQKASWNTGFSNNNARASMYLSISLMPNPSPLSLMSSTLSTHEQHHSYSEAEDQDDCTLSLTTADVRRAHKRINPQKSPGPDGIPGRVLRECADQLAEIFTSIFNLCLYQSAVPTVFKQTTIVPIPKKPSITCLNDYRPVALTPIIMKCFKRLVRTHICSTLPGTPFNLHTIPTDQ